MPEYDMFALKVPTKKARYYDKLIQLTQTGVIPGHMYKDRSALMRTALEQLATEIQEVLKNPDMVATAMAKLINEVREVSLDNEKDLD